MWIMVFTQDPLVPHPSIPPLPPAIPHFIVHPGFFIAPIWNCFTHCSRRSKAPAGRHTGSIGSVKAKRGYPALTSIRCNLWPKAIARGDFLFVRIENKIQRYFKSGHCHRWEVTDFAVSSEVLNPRQKHYQIRPIALEARKVQGLAKELSPHRVSPTKPWVQQQWTDGIFWSGIIEAKIVIQLVGPIGRIIIHRSGREGRSAC